MFAKPFSRRAARVVLSFFCFLVCFEIASAQTNEWRPVSGNRRDNLSGMALVRHDGRKTVFIVVNDNKKPEQNHAALVSVEDGDAPKYQPLNWLGDDQPTDLEAVTSVPDAPDEFMAMTAAGRVFRVRLDLQNNSIKVLKSFDVPAKPSAPDFEAFALQNVNGNLLAVWADRGLDAKPAQLFWSRFDLKTDAFAQIDSTFLKVPYPKGNTRHVSDVKVDPSGAAFITSASDPDNNGPFSSAFYFAGTFNLCNPQKIAFNQSPTLTRLFAFDYHKVEAIEFVPGAGGGIAFGTDDENLGAAIRLDW